MSSETRIEWRPGETPDAVLFAQFVTKGPLVEHQLGVRWGERETVWLHSHQAEPLGEWPLSPPLQSFQVAEDGEGRPLMLATGLAGKSHWSLAVSVQGRALLFDVACRTGELPAFLGSSYRLGSAGEVTAAEANATARGGQVVTLRSDRAEHRAQLQLVGDERFGSGFRLAGTDPMAIVPTDQSLEAASTVRWAYAWSVEPT